MQIERIVPTENDIESPTFTVKNYTEEKVTNIKLFCC